MARPAKSVKVKTGEIAKEELTLRDEVENALRGDVERPEAPPHLAGDQRDIFEFIVNNIAKEVLGRLDVFVLESTATAIARLRHINEMINNNGMLLMNTALQNTRAKYQADLWRGCSELCLSPQARARMGSLAAQSAKAESDPLKAALLDD